MEAVESAFDALERLGANRYDAILLDYQMPGMTGLELIQKMRLHREWRSVPVITMTASDHHGQECLPEGAHSFLRKPYNVNMLLDSVKRACSIQMAIFPEKEALTRNR